MEPSDAINQAYNDLLLRESKESWQEKYGEEIECPCCLDFYIDKSGCSCNIHSPCSYCTRESDCNHTIGDCVELLGIDDYNNLVKG
jgi:hypothetical protein